MHQNETTLTPIFRYIITRLEENITIDNKNCILEINKFIESIREYNESFTSVKMYNNY